MSNFYRHLRYKVRFKTTIALIIMMLKNDSVTLNIKAKYRGLKSTYGNERVKQ